MARGQGSLLLLSAMISALGDLGEAQSIRGATSVPTDKYLLTWRSKYERDVSFRTRPATGQLIYAWGSGQRGELGQGDSDVRDHADYNAPIAVKTLPYAVYTFVVAGKDSSYAITREGHFFSWGRNDFGQLGISSKADQDAPQISKTNGSGVLALATGNNHVLLLNGAQQFNESQSIDVSGSWKIWNASFVLLGDANIGDDGQVCLTTNGLYKRGALWFKEMQDVTRSWSVRFAFALTNPIGEGGDGLAFVIHNSPKGLNSIGEFGNDLGVANSAGRGGIGIENSVAFEIDTQDDAGFEVRGCNALQASRHSRMQTRPAKLVNSLLLAPHRCTIPAPSLLTTPGALRPSKHYDCPLPCPIACSCGMCLLHGFV